MDREKLYKFFEKCYVPKRGVLPRLPLGVDPEVFWTEILRQRKLKCTELPLHGAEGIHYWYMTTGTMVTASEKVVEEFLEIPYDADPYLNAPAITPLEEIIYTSYVEGSQIAMKEAMVFLEGGGEPRDIEEQMLLIIIRL